MLHSVRADSSQTAVNSKPEKRRVASHFSLAQRVREPEVMDDPNLDAAQLYGALGGLTTINRLSASARIVWKPILRLAKRLPEKPLRILDIATGAGDIPRALWQKARRAGLRLDLHAIDISGRTLDFARQRAKASGAEITFSQHDVFAGDVPRGFDVIISSLFLHHLENDSAVRLLGAMSRAANHMVLVNDLLRGWNGLLLAHFAGFCLTRSKVVRVDAVRSVRAAFTIPEAYELASAAGLEGANISRKWPSRFLLSWQRPTMSPAAN